MMMMMMIDYDRSAVSISFQLFSAFVLPLRVLISIFTNLAILFFLFILCGINLIFASCLEGQRSPGKFRAFTDLWQPAEGNERAEPGDAGRWFAEKCFSPLSFCPSSGWIMKSLGFYISHHFGGQNIKVEMVYYRASSCFCLQRIYWEITDSSSSECPDLR